MNPLSPKEFYHNFREICDMRDLTMKDVLSPAGVHEGYPSRWRNGNKRVKGKLPDYQQLAKMAKKLDCTLDDLVYGYRAGQNVSIPIKRYKKIEKA